MALASEPDRRFIGTTFATNPSGYNFVLAKLTSPFKEFGWFAGLLYSIDRVLQRLSPNLRLYFYELLVQPIPAEPLLSGKLARSFEAREIHRGDPEVAVMPARPEIKESRFDQGAVCLGTFKRDEFVGHIWFCFDAYQEDEARCTFVLPDDGQSVFDFDLYVFPQYRMGLGFLGVWNGACELLRQRGTKFSFSRLTRVNIASRNAHQKLGTRIVARVFVLKLFSWELFASTIAPFLYLSTGPGKRVRLKLKSRIQQPPALTEQAAAF